MRGVAPLMYYSRGSWHRGASIIVRIEDAESGVAPLIVINTALPMESDRQGRAPRGPYFFFFLVAFFLATASPPFAELE
jgi:hypothetical protein